MSYYILICLNTVLGSWRCTNLQSRSIQMTVANVIEAYGVCMSSLHKSIMKRHNMSLKRVAPIIFSKKVKKDTFKILGYI